MHPVHALHRGPVLLRRGDQVRNVDAPDDQHAVLFADLSPYVRPQPAVTGVDPARLQRASEGSGQSGTGGRHDVVEGGRDLAIWLRAVVLLHGAVDAELDGTVVRG